MDPTAALAALAAHDAIDYGVMRELAEIDPRLHHSARQTVLAFYGERLGAIYAEDVAP